MNKRKATQLLVEFSVDLSSLLFANLISFLLCTAIHKIPNLTKQSAWIYVICLVLSFCVIFFGFSVSLDLSVRNRLREFIAVVRNCLLTYMTLSVALVLTRSDLVNGRYMFLISLFLFISFSCINRYFTKRLLIRHFSHSGLVNLAGVITVGRRAEDFLSNLPPDWTRHIKGVAVIDAEYQNGNYVFSDALKSSGGNAVAVKPKAIKYVSSVPVVANLDNVIDWVKRESLDEVYINVPYEYESKIAQLAEEIESMGIMVHINLPTLEKLVENSEFDNVECTMVAGYPTATLTAARQLPLSAVIFKRIVDIIGGFLGSLISLPVILVVAVPLLIESRGPLIFKQPRIGKNGRVFNIYKLRSMYVDAEERKKELLAKNEMNGYMFKMDNDPRITKVGRFIRRTSIDELPQFWNVLKGDMSLVGTRPPTLDEFSKYESHHKRRLSMRPGITGMWQVSGRSKINNFEDVVKLDCEYIDNWSAWLDLKIMFKTVGVVLRGIGAE